MNKTIVFKARMKALIIIFFAIIEAYNLELGKGLSLNNGME